MKHTENYNFVRIELIYNINDFTL